MKFRLLAPHTPWVKLEGSWMSEPVAMTQAEEGWWEVDQVIPDGTHTYTFRLISNSSFLHHQEVTVADPLASLIIKGQSAVIIKDNRDVSLAYEWHSEDQPLPQNYQLNIYELHIAEFGAQQSQLGTFKTVEQRLDYLQQLGINAIEIMPVMWFADQHDWGYSVRFPCAVHESYGCPQDLQRLVEACHQRGIRVILDIVFNHMEQYSPLTQIDFNYWFREDRPGEESYGPKFDYERLDPDINDIAATRFNLLVARHWIEHYHIDGFRLDATAILNNYAFIHALHHYSHQLCPFKPFFIVAEQLPEDPTIVGHQGPADSSWHQEFEFEVVRALTHEGDNIKTLAKALDPANLGYMFPHNIVNYIESHDEHTLMEKLAAAGISGQMAHRKGRLAAALLYTAIGNTMIYQGQEFGGHRERDKVVKPLQWNLLNHQYGQSLHAMYQTYSRLRRDLPLLHQGKLAILSTANHVLIYQRSQDSQQIIVVANLRDTPISSHLSLTTGRWTELLSETVYQIQADQSLVLSLSPSQVKILIYHDSLPTDSKEQFVG